MGQQAEPATILAVAIELADSGAFVSAGQIVRALECLAYRVDSLAEPGVHGVLNERCASALKNARVGR